MDSRPPGFLYLQKDLGGTTQHKHKNLGGRPQAQLSQQERETLAKLCLRLYGED